MKEFGLRKLITLFFLALAVAALSLASSKKDGKGNKSMFLMANADVPAGGEGGGCFGGESVTCGAPASGASGGNGGGEGGGGGCGC